MNPDCIVGVMIVVAVTTGTSVAGLVAARVGMCGVFAGAHERSKSIEAISKRKSKRWGITIMDVLYVTGLAHSRNTYETFRAAD
jgi:hypothetical protein